MSRTKEDVICEAEFLNRENSAFRDFWRTPDWKLVTIQREIHGRTGLAFSKGEVTIARVEKNNTTITAFSPKMNMGFTVKRKDIRWK